MGSFSTLLTVRIGACGLVDSNLDGKFKRMLNGKFNIQIMKSHTRDTSLSVDPQGTGRSVLRYHVGKSKLGVLHRPRPLTVGKKAPEEILTCYIQRNISRILKQLLMRNSLKWVIGWMQTNFLLTLVNLTLLHSILTNTNQTAQFNWKFIITIFRKSVPLEQKTFVKYLGLLIDNNLSWKYHINYIRHLVTPFATLLNIFRSLIEPYISYGLIAWGQAANIHLNKVLILQKCALPLMYFADSNALSAPLFVHSRILPVTMVYYHLVSSMMHDINNHRVPSNISMLFTHSQQVHHHFPRFSAAGNLYVKTSRTDQLFFSFARIRVRVWNSIPVKLRIKNRARLSVKSKLGC